MNIKETYRRFREWQIAPFDYSNRSKGYQKCANCGTEFNDNFCPRCGQKAGVGGIGWQTVRQGLMIIWGMDNRSFGYSLLQLLLRPGYMISDYLSGKRQVSFPPVKMLLLVAIGMMLADYFFESPAKDYSSQGDVNTALDMFDNWSERNLGWAVLVVSTFFLLPTWLHFRYSPKHYHHTLPEGFFIQVFMSSLMIMTAIVCTIIGSFQGLLFIPCWYVIAYRQLFGYSWWGTLWRVCCCIIEGMIAINLVAYVANIIMGAPHEEKKLMLSLTVWLVLAIPIGYLIDRLRHKKRNKKK